MPASLWTVAAATLTLVVSAQAQNDTSTPPSTFPHAYPGIPSGDFSPVWQNYYEVKDPLPNVTFPLRRSFAGNIPVDRAGHPNDTLFFWGFEHENGSLTSEKNLDTPWALWLNGGPGASSMLGLLLENGPLHIDVNGNAVPNNFSWDQLVDYIWVDQPVGVGYSTADSEGYIADEDQMGEDFVGFLSNLVKVFPGLAKRPLLLTGESYAGTYIPYITKSLFSKEKPPVKLSKIAMGNAAIGSINDSEEGTAVNVIETYPQLIGYDPEVFEYFREQSHLCGYDYNLTYPQTGGPIPSGGLDISAGGDSVPFLQSRSRSSSAKSLKAIASYITSLEEPANKKRAAEPKYAAIQREKMKRTWKKGKRDLSGRANGTIDPWYGCFLGAEVQDYALNFSLPWSAHAEVVIEDINAFAPFNPYDVPDARFPAVSPNPIAFMNDNRTRTALHAPTSKDWSLLFFPTYPFGNTFNFPPDVINPFGDPSPPATSFLSELATNTTKQNISVIIYSGNDDSVVSHINSEVVIQNTTFGGIQGFTKEPDTPWYDDEGNFAGIVRQERGWTFVLVENAGHEVPEFNPEAGLVMFREFILGNNQTGLVEGSSVVGGEDPSLRTDHALAGQTGILAGSGTATSLFFYPSATIAAWNSFFATAVATAPQVTPSAV